MVSSHAVIGIKRRRWKVHDYFLLLLCKSSIWFTEKHIFKIIIYFFNASKCAANYVISFEVYDGFLGQNVFEVMKAGKLAIRPWLRCPSNEHTLVDFPSSVVLPGLRSDLLFLQLFCKILLECLSLVHVHRYCKIASTKMSF